MLARHVAAVLLLVAVSTPAVTHAESLHLFRDVQTQVLRYPHFTIFDSVSARLDNGVVTLSGKVTMPYKRDEIARRVGRLSGVRDVHNRIEVLPASQFDDELRIGIARAIYTHPMFATYASMVNPPIHVIVERGRVTLEGVVNSQVERMLARAIASSFVAFDVRSELKTDAEVQALLEAL
jgi:hyperosmotically inducible protein